jgi:hypothetical protein
VGCYVQAGKEEALKDEGIDLAVGNNRKKDLAAILEEYLSGRQERIEKGECGRALQKAAIIDISQTAEYEDMKIGARQRKGMRGCRLAIQPNIPGHFSRYRTAVISSALTALFLMSGGESEAVNWRMQKKK